MANYHFLSLSINTDGKLVLPVLVKQTALETLAFCLKLTYLITQIGAQIIIRIIIHL